MEQINELLRRCVREGGSDLHFKTDTGKIYMRVLGDLKEVTDAPTFNSEEFRQALHGILKQEQLDRFDKELELDFSHEVVGVSRFRGNLYQQRHHIQAAFRVIPYEIATMEELQLPPATYDFVERPRGLVLVTGPAGSGKSTTLAAMIDKINRNHQVHIITVEDPTEFVHDDHVALLNQRELGEDTLAFANALKHVLRQDPDVILIGEMRDLETIHLAITAAETGHLVFATLHTVDAVQTVDRIIDVFPITQQQQVRMQLSVNLVGVVSQTLVKRKDGRGRIAAFEVLNATSAIRNLIRENKSYQIGSIIQTGAKQKMQTLDQSLVKLVERGLVNPEDAKVKAKDPGEFMRLLQLAAAAQPQGPATPQAGQGPVIPGSNAYGQGTIGATTAAPPPSGGAPPPGTGAPPPNAVRGQPNRPGYKRD
ncbi:MAG: type IV pilus twitching motility protein PilT [Fimbriimonadaceae bacterium]|nr:type IV pilus twitching motility protein PilT [Fimbriimonadaceae bacterium]